jgi:group I intron endonuclease
VLKVTSGIYKIQNNVTGGIYIGCSQNIEKRFKQHQNRLKRGNHPNLHLQSSVNKHGLENFTFEVLFESYCEEYVLKNLESFFIWSENPEKLYNIVVPEDFQTKSINYLDFQERKVKAWKETVSKNGGLPRKTPELKQRQSEAVSGEKNGFFGKEHSEETKEILRAKAKDRWSNPQERFSQSQRRKEFFNNPENRAKVGESFRGRKHSEKTKQKISEKSSGSKNPRATPFVFNGIRYGSFVEAEKALGISKYKLKKLLKPNDYLERE